MRFIIKNFTYTIMESNKSQGLQGESESWKPRRAHGLAPVHTQSYLGTLWASQVDT